MKLVRQLPLLEIDQCMMKNRRSRLFQHQRPSETPSFEWPEATISFQFHVARCSWSQGCSNSGLFFWLSWCRASIWKMAACWITSVLRDWGWHHLCPTRPVLYQIGGEGVYWNTRWWLQNTSAWNDTPLCKESRRGWSPADIFILGFIAERVPESSFDSIQASPWEKAVWRSIRMMCEVKA